MSESIHTETLAVDYTAANFDLRALQESFADMFDQAASALFRMGLDQDDTVFDRYLACEFEGARFDVSADWLADRERLLAHLLKKVAWFAAQEPETGSPDRESGGASVLALRDPQCVRITGLKVIVRRESLP